MPSPALGHITFFLEYFKAFLRTPRGSHSSAVLLEPSHTLPVLDWIMAPRYAEGGLTGNRSGHTEARCCLQALQMRRDHRPSTQPGQL